MKVLILELKFIEKLISLKKGQINLVFWNGKIILRTSVANKTELVSQRKFMT